MVLENGDPVPVLLLANKVCLDVCVCMCMHKGRRATAPSNLKVVSPLKFSVIRLE